LLVRSSEGVTETAGKIASVLMMFTLVPFAGSNLIRFRGSRINGLSPCGHSDKMLFYAQNAKRPCISHKKQNGFSTITSKTRSA